MQDYERLEIELHAEIAALKIAVNALSQAVANQQKQIDTLFEIIKDNGKIVL